MSISCEVRVSNHDEAPRRAGITRLRNQGTDCERTREVGIFIENRCLAGNEASGQPRIAARPHERVQLDPFGDGFPSVDDNGTIQVARQISKKIETEMDYPGQVKVTVVRESRAVEYAR